MEKLLAQDLSRQHNFPSNKEFVTIQEAINKGLKEIALPSKIIVITSVVTSLLLVLLGFSWWNLLWLPIGKVLSTLYKMRATARWRIWAYERVADIHQLQRSAELAGLLRLRSHESTRGMMSASQRERLISLQSRFTEECPFSDDESFPKETLLHYRSLTASKDPLLILNDMGIHVYSEGTFDWKNVKDERIIQIGLSKMSARTGGEVSVGWREYFRFECPVDTIEIPLSDLDIPAWKLDLLLYIHRGRFNQTC